MENKEIIIQQLIATPEFATLPTVTMNILQMLENIDDIDIRELSKCIEMDASITIKTLKTANSPIFAVSENITTINHAITLLGINRITTIVLGVSIFSKFMQNSNKNIKNIMTEYWQHTAAVAIVSKSLTTRLGFNFNEYEFLGGLLHDIGKLVMLQYDVNKELEVFKKVLNEGMVDYEAEQEVWGIDHAELGAIIAEKWKLPKILQDIIRYNRDFTKATEKTQDIVAVVAICNILCNMWGTGFFEGNKRVIFEQLPEYKYLSTLKDKDIDFAEITFQLEQNYKDASSFLKIISGV